MDNTEIINIPMGTSNAYLIKNDDNIALVDAGNASKTKRIVKKLTSLSLSPEDIQLIILTHTHYDHVGSLKEIKQISGAKVVVHENERQYLQNGSTPLPNGTMWFSKFIIRIINILPRGIDNYSPVKAEITFTEKFDLNPFGIDAYILHTPGHTLGSSCVIVNGKTKKAIVGDTLFGIFKNTVFPPFADNPKLLLKSWNKLLNTEAQIFYPGHGKAFNREKMFKTLKKGSMLKSMNK